MLAGTGEELQPGSFVTYLLHAGFPAERTVYASVRELAKENVLIEFVTTSSKKYEGKFVYVGHKAYVQPSDLSVPASAVYLKKYSVLLVEKMNNYGILPYVLEGGKFEGYPQEWVEEILGSLNGKESADV